MGLLGKNGVDENLEKSKLFVKRKFEMSRQNSQILKTKKMASFGK